MEKRMCGFLEKEGIFSDNWDWREETSRYREEMEPGRAGKRLFKNDAFLTWEFRKNCLKQTGGRAWMREEPLKNRFGYFSAKRSASG